MKKEEREEIVESLESMRKILFEGVSMISSGDSFGYVLLGEVIGNIGTLIFICEDMK